MWMQLAVAGAVGIALGGVSLWVAFDAERNPVINPEWRLERHQSWVRRQARITAFRRMAWAGFLLGALMVGYGYAWSHP